MTPYLNLDLCDMTHPYGRHDALIRVMWFIYLCACQPRRHPTAIETCMTWRIHMGDMTHAYVRHDLFIGVHASPEGTLLQLRPVRNNWFIWATWRIHMCDMTHFYMSACQHRRHPTAVVTCVTWLIHMCDMTHSYVQHDTLMCAAWLIHTCDIHVYVCMSAQKVPYCNWDLCDMTHSYWRHDSSTRATWRIHACDMTCSYVRHDSFICVHASPEGILLQT